MLPYETWANLDKQFQDKMIYLLIKDHSRYTTTEIKYNNYCGPSCVGRLYTNELFPRLVINNDILKVKDNNIYDGELYEDDINLTMSWCGYISRLYDGELMLYVKDDKSVITGFNGDNYFEFKEDKLISGSWPEFLCIYSPKI